MFDKGERINLSGLHSERIMLRLMERLDEERVWSILSDHQTLHSAVICKDHSYYQSKKILDQILSRDVDHNVHFGICCGKGHELIGVVSLQQWNRIESVATLGYMLDRLHWGRGLATEAVEILIKFGFEELGLDAIEGKCHEDNMASAKVMIKNGFTWNRMHPERYGSDSPTSKINIFNLSAACYKRNREK